MVGTRLQRLCRRQCGQVTDPTGITGAKGPGKLAVGGDVAHGDLLCEGIDLLEEVHQVNIAESPFI